MCTCLSFSLYESNRELALAKRMVREAFSGPPRPQCCVCSISFTLVALVDRGSRTAALDITDSWVHSPLGISSRSVRDNLNGVGFAIISRSNANDLSYARRSSESIYDDRIDVRNLPIRNIIIYVNRLFNVFLRREYSSAFLYIILYLFECPLLTKIYRAFLVEISCIF